MRTQRALVVLNWGIGNNLIAAPLLEALDRTRALDEYHVLCRRPFLTDALQRHVSLPRMRIARLPDLARRFGPHDWNAIFAFLDSAGIDLVINLRLEIADLDADYLRFRDVAQRRRVRCWDLHEDGMWEAGSIGERAWTLLRRHGIDLAEARQDWLAPLHRPQQDLVGCFVGASRGVKRWPARMWTETVLRVRERGWRVELGSGPDRVERDLAHNVADAVGDPDVHVAPSASVDGLAQWVGGLTALVSNDTAAAHLAAAIGAPVVSLHVATDAYVWRPLGASARPLQSAIAKRCRAMKRDGTCLRLYKGCPAPCRNGVTAAMVLDALEDLMCLSTMVI